MPWKKVLLTNQARSLICERGQIVACLRCNLCKGFGGHIDSATGCRGEALPTVMDYISITYTTI